MPRLKYNQDIKVDFNFKNATIYLYALVARELRHIL